VHAPPEDYRCLFPLFIQSWRQRFVYANALGPMAFGFLQLQVGRERESEEGDRKDEYSDSLRVHFGLFCA